MTDPHEPNPQNEKQVLSTYKAELEVKLHAEEVHDYAKRLAAIEGEVAQHEDHAKSVKADLAAKAAALKAERSKVALKVRTEKEVRQVPCTITAHWRTNRAITTRDDTGEVIAERPLSAGERQTALAIGEAKGVADGLLAAAREPEQAEAKKKDEPVLTTPPCKAVTLGGICTVHGSDCPNPETIKEREAKAPERRKMKMIDDPPKDDPPPSDEPGTDNGEPTP